MDTRDRLLLELARAVYAFMPYYHPPLTRAIDAHQARCDAEDAEHVRKASEIGAAQERITRETK